MPIQAAFPELRRYSGYMWYQRTFNGEDTSGEVLLDFGLYVFLIALPIHW